MTTFDTSSLETLRQAQEQLTARLTHFRRRVRMRLVLEAVAIVMAEAVGVALLTFLADHTFRLGVPARLALLLVAIGFLAWECNRRILSAIRLRLGLVALAGAIDRHNPNGPRDLAARVASILELPRLLEGPNPPSPAMVDRAVRRAHESLAAVQFDTALDPQRLRKMLGILTAAILLPLLLAILFPATAGLWARRLFLASHQPWPQSTYLDVADLHDNRIAVPRGEPYVLRAKARDRSLSPARISLTLRPTEGGASTTVLMKEFAKNDFRHDFAVIDQPLTLELEGGDDDVGPILLTPVDRPRITGLTLTSQHPRQPAPEQHPFTGGDGDFSFLVKTRLSLAVAANVPLAELRLHAGSPHPTTADLHRIDATHYTIDWTQEGPAKFDMELVSADVNGTGGLVSLPVPISIGLKADQPPRVTMAYTGVRPRITASARIPLSIDARDDFGVIQASLAMKDETPDVTDPAKLIPHEASRSLFPTPASSQPSSPPTPAPAPEPLLTLREAIDVAPMKLPVGTLLSVTALATDDCYTGRQTARSRTVTFRVVAPEELFREILQRQQAERIKFRKQMEEAEKIRDLLKTPLDSRAIADLARRHRAFQRETQRITGVLNDSFTEMTLNALGSPESHTLMRNNVLTPLKALQDELVTPQINALDTLNPDDAARSGAAADREANIAARMKTILQQMAQWDSFVDVLNQLDGIIKMETQVKESSENLQHKETEGLFDK